ncbi:MAG TPA: MaoC family dehydratase N-terminal domain-containing protein [Rhodocyclaceae bacterium]
MNFQSWIGRVEEATDVVNATPMAALAATLDRPADRPPIGTPLPPLWHWLYFLPLHRQSDLGPDGHAQRGGFLPPVPLPRRMWAGSRFEFHKPLSVGDTLTRRSTIDNVTEKQGRSGPLVFVTVRHDIGHTGENDVALTEFHDIVYRDSPKSGDPAPTRQAADASPTWERQWVPDDVLLFRYSALTFNGHRIHYDRRYVTEVEGYPGLVVHGPLIATLLLDLLREMMPASDVLRYEFRAVRPLFDTQPFFVCGKPQAGGESVRLWARDSDGWLAMEAMVELRPSAKRV